MSYEPNAGSSVTSGGSVTSNSFHLADDIPLSFGNTQASPDVEVIYETADANANHLLFYTPTAGAVNVPVIGIADTSLKNTDIGLFNGITEPSLAVLNTGGTTYARIYADTAGRLESVGGNLRLTASTEEIFMGTGTGESTVWILGGASARNALFLGAGTAGYLSYEAHTLYDQATIGIRSNLNTHMVITEYLNADNDYDHADAGYPVVYFHDGTDPDTDNTLYGSLAHDGTDFVIGVGSGLIRTDGGIGRNQTTVNAATYDLVETDDTLLVTYTGTGAVTSLTLPTAQTVAGRTIVIKDAGGNAGTNNITIDTEGAQTIDGAATLVISSDYESFTLTCDGSNWFII